MAAGPFAKHPANVAELDRLAGKLTASGSALASVGTQATGHGQRAGTVESTGLSADIQQAVRPVAVAGGLLDEASTLAGRALAAWATRVGIYNEAMGTLNQLWAIAKANDFGVEEADPRAADPAKAAADREGDIEDARASTYAALLRGQRRAQRRLDDDADVVAAALNADPGEDSPVSLASFSSDGDSVKERADEIDRLRREHIKELHPQPGDTGEAPGWLGDVFDFLLMDPDECAGDDASTGWCAAEVAGIIPFGKWLKGLKVVKLADDAPVPKPDPPASSAAQAKRLANQLAAEQLSNAHAYSKHIHEFDRLGITTREQFRRHVEDVLNDASDVEELPRGRTIYWHESTGTVVFRDPSSTDGGTAFIPRDGKAYFDRLARRS